MYGRNTRGLPGTLAPMYHELAVGNSVMSPQSLTCCDPAGLGRLGRLDALEPVRRAGRPSWSAIQSTCCSIDTDMFDSTDGLPGPVIMNRFGKPDGHQAEVRHRPVGPLRP